MRIRVAGAQISVTSDIAENRRAIFRAINYANEQKADILLTPEGSLSGYTHEFDQRKTEIALADIIGLASKHGVGLALGTCFAEQDGRCYDQLRFYDPDGSYLGFHSKTLTCGTLTDPSEGEIEHYAVSPLRTFEIKGILCGGLVCNDLWANPIYTPMADSHLTQQLSELGARIIFHAVNGGSRDDSEFSRVVTKNYHESNLRMRARAGKVHIVTVDSCYPLDLHCSSPSGVLGSEGNWLTQVPMQGERFFSHDIVIET